MTLHARLLLVVCLLMQAVGSGAGVCRPGAGDATAAVSAVCVVDACCCSAHEEAAPSCGCLDDPSGNEDPAPVWPSSTGAGRDLLPAVAWFERREAGPPGRRAAGLPADVASHPGASARESVPVALTVRYCVFLI